MKILLRDDDPNYFTDCNELKKIYEKIFEHKGKITIGVIPYHGFTKSRSIPESISRFEGRKPVHQNRELVSYLRDLASKDMVEICMHGYSHVDLANCYEYEAQEGLIEQTLEGKVYLENLFEVKIQTFIPPHNSIKKHGEKAIEIAGLNILNSFGYRLSERRISFSSVVSFLKLLGVFCSKGKQRRLGKPIKVNNHLEFGCYHFLSGDSASSTIRKLELDLKEATHIFGIAFHYWEIMEDPLYSEFLKLLSNLEKYDHVLARDLWYNE